MLDNFFKSKKNLHKFDLIHTICIVSFILVLTVYLSISNRFYNASYAIDDTNYLFLSDLPHITANNWSFVGWGSLGKDKNPENKTISLMVDGKAKIFTKGIGMHAKSQLTYNILDYSGEYTRFVTKIGVDASRGTNGSVWFQITASKDGENWTELYKSPVMNGNTNAIDVDVPEFINPDNKDKYEAKYHLAAFNVPYGGNVSISDRNNQRYWMVFEAGGICWNISRVGSSISKTVGLPSTGLYQPDHEVYLFYDQDANGNGFWSLGNNIFGWGKSSTKWYGGNPYRLIFNWGNKYFTDQVMNSKNYGTSSGYMYLGQANLNNLAAYRESYYLNLLANSYSDNEIKLSIYNKALKVNPLNLDSYDYKINMYKALNKNSREWKTYAEEIISAYKFYPQAMYDLLKVIKPFLEVTDLMDIEMKEHAALEEATHATKNEIWQDLAARELANALLGRDNKADIASFSFDGENAGKIMINSAYDEYDFAWYYSLDGGKTLSEVITAHSYQLTPKEIASITEENDIQIAIQGLGDLTPDYTFDIQKGTISSTLYANDLENRVIGVSLSYEWRNSEEEEWTSYSVSSPNNTGDKTLYVRAGATGRYVPSDQAIFTFTEDNQPDTAKYIPIRHLSVEGYSTQSKDSKRPFYAPNAIDGNINTIWHTDFAQNVLQQPTKPFYTIKLDNARYISALETVNTLN